MRHVVVRSMQAAILGVAMFTSSVYAQEITGAGATFPAPLYSKWADSYKKESGISLNYQAIGSGGGINQIKNKTVTFGASDMPLKPEDLNQIGLVQFPTVIGGVVPIVNLEGVSSGELTIDGPTLAKIYLGEIKTWNDPAIAKLNPSAKLPETAIATVHRSDGSGTNFLFTNYLSAVSADFKGKVGASTSVSWPGGIGAKGNEGVAAQVKQTKGAIGYVEYFYSAENKLPSMKMVNTSGKTVTPAPDAFKASAAGADWTGTPGFQVILTNQPGDAAWPISGATFILMYKNPADPKASEQTLKFFDWAYKNGDAAAGDLYYVPMPDGVKKAVRDLWAKEIGAKG